MGDKIIIGNKEFVLDDIGYYIGKMDVWEKETDIFLEIKANEKDVDDIVFEKINWLNKNKSKIIDTFMVILPQTERLQRKILSNHFL